jgi:hypothetical protein
VAKKKKSAVEESGERNDSQKQLERWQTRIATARRLREDWERDQNVLEAEQYFYGEQNARSRGRNRSFNHFRATVRTQKPNLFYNNPKFFVRPIQGMEATAVSQKAAQGEAILERIGSQDDNFKNAASLALLQAFFRIGVIKTCYDPTLEPNPRAGEPIMVMQEGMLAKDDMGNPIPMKNPLTGEAVTEPDMVMQDEAYRYEYVDARTMLLPDAGPDQKKWPWIAEEVTVSLDDAKEDERFPKERRTLLKSNATSKTTDSGKKRKTEPEGDELFKYIEIYDLRKKEQIIYADGQDFDDFLVKQPLPRGIEDHPYSILNLGDPILSPDPSPWPCPKTKSWVPLQDSYNLLRKMIDEGAKRSARKIMYSEDTFAGAEEMAKFGSSDDMTGVKLNDVARPPVPWMDPPLAPDLYKACQLLQMDWRIVTGTSGARAGSEEGASATESSFVERAANLRDKDEQGSVNDWLSEAGQKMFQLVKDTLTLDMWIKLRDFKAPEIIPAVAQVLGMDPAQLGVMLELMPEVKKQLEEQYGKERWDRVTREDLTFEADVTVVPGSSRPVNLDAEKSSAMEFMTTIGTAPQLLLSPELLTWIGEKFDPAIPKNVLMSLNQLAMAMMGATQAQAGHAPGSDKGGPNPGAGTGKTAGNPAKGPQLQGVIGGLTR